MWCRGGHSLRDRPGRPGQEARSRQQQGQARVARVEQRWEDREGGGAGPDHRGLHTAVLSFPSQWSTGRASSCTIDPAIYGPRNAGRRGGRGGGSGAGRTSAKSGGKTASGLPSKHTTTGAAPSPNTPLQGAPSLTPAWRARRRGHGILAWTPVHSGELTSYIFHPYRGQRLGNAPHLCPIVRGRKAAAQTPTLTAKGECHGTKFSSERDGIPLQLCPPCRQSVRGLCFFAEGAAGQRPHRAQISLGTDSHVQWEHRSFKSPSVFASRISRGEKGCHLLPGPVESELTPTTARSTPKADAARPFPVLRGQVPHPGPQPGDRSVLVGKEARTHPRGRPSQPVLDEDKFTSKSNHLTGDDVHRSVLFKTHTETPAQKERGPRPQVGPQQPHRAPAQASSGRSAGSRPLAAPQGHRELGPGGAIRPQRRVAPGTVSTPRPAPVPATAHPPLSGSSGYGSRSCTSGSQTYS